MKNKLIYRVIFLAIIILGIYIYFGYSPNKQNKLTVSKTHQTTDEVVSKDMQFPFLDLPVEYFSGKKVQWGSAGKGTSGTITDYTQIALNDVAVYQSYPTKMITIKNYSSEIKPLKTKSFSEVMLEFSNSDPQGYGKTSVEESYNKFGTLATNYLPADYIQNLNKFDVDEDGTAEQIVTYNFVGSADAGSYRSDIIKGNNIIFSVQEDNASIVPADTANGFYVEWRSADDSAPRCCPEGFKRTRFVFKDGQFVPIYEQDVKYLKIGKE